MQLIAHTENKYLLVIGIFLRQKTPYDFGDQKIFPHRKSMFSNNVFFKVGCYIPGGR